MSRPERSANQRMSRTAADGQEDIEQRAVRDRGELLVRHGNRPGQANPDALVWGEPERRGVLRIVSDAAAPGSKRIKIEDRLHADEPAKLVEGPAPRPSSARSRRKSQDVPASSASMVVERSDKRLGEILGRDGAVLHPSRNESKRLRQAPQALDRRRACRERAERGSAARSSAAPRRRTGTTARCSRRTRLPPTSSTALMCPAFVGEGGSQ